MFGNYGEGAATQEVLDGTFVIPDSATEPTADFLRACSYLDGVQKEMDEDDVVTQYLLKISQITEI